MHNPFTSLLNALRAWGDRRRFEQAVRRDVMYRNETREWSYITLGYCHPPPSPEELARWATGKRRTAWKRRTQAIDAERRDFEDITGE